MTPKLIHFIWIGDRSLRPDNCMDSWRVLNPEWTFLLWSNAELDDLAWHNRAHMAALRARGDMAGVADLMRWEILHANGGIVVEADSVALRPLDDDLLDCPAFACWENEIALPGILSAAHVGCVSGNPLIRRIVQDIAATPDVTTDMSWKTVGSLRLTESYRATAYTPLRIYPSHYFQPEHFSGLCYEGEDPVYARHLWAGQRGLSQALPGMDLSRFGAGMDWQAEGRTAA